MTWHLLHHSHHDNAEAPSYHQPQSAHTPPTERQTTPMSATAVQNILSDVRDLAAKTYHGIEAAMAEAVKVAEAEAPAAATVISELEPVLAAMGIPSVVVSSLASGIRKVAANPAIQALAAAEHAVNPDNVAASTVAAAVQEIPPGSLTAAVPA